MKKLIHLVFIVRNGNTTEVARCAPSRLEDTIANVRRTGLALGCTVVDNAGQVHRPQASLGTERIYIKVDTH